MSGLHWIASSDAKRILWSTGHVWQGKSVQRDTHHWRPPVKMAICPAESAGRAARDGLHARTFHQHIHPMYLQKIQDVVHQCMHQHGTEPEKILVTYDFFMKLNNELIMSGSLPFDNPNHMRKDLIFGGKTRVYYYPILLDLHDSYTDVIAWEVRPWSH